jgi:hypothetical protein
VVWAGFVVSAFLEICTFCEDGVVFEVLVVFERISFGRIIKEIVSNRKGAQLGLKKRIFILSSRV